MYYIISSDNLMECSNIREQKFRHIKYATISTTKVTCIIIIQDAMIY